MFEVGKKYKKGVGGNTIYTCELIGEDQAIFSYMVTINNSDYKKRYVVFPLENSAIFKKYVEPNSVEYNVAVSPKGDPYILFTEPFIKSFRTLGKIKLTTFSDGSFTIEKKEL